MNAPYDHGFDDEAVDPHDGPEPAYCPACGPTTVRVRSIGSTGGPDPYGVDRLECGHDVVAFGPDEADVAIVRAWPRP